VLILVLVAACDDEEPPETAPRGPALFSGKWVGVKFEDVALAVPEEFTRDVRDFQNGQRLFCGPTDKNGCTPSVQVIRQPYAGTTRQWFERWRDKHLRGPRGITKVIESGPAAIGGRSGYALVYQIPEGEWVYLTIAWLWVENGHGYIVRGHAEKQSCVAVYRDVFEKVKSTVRLMP
jgi:hypothetical protein